MDYRSVIESAYNRESWQKLLYDIFKNGVAFLQRPEVVEEDSRLATSALRLGTITLPDLNKIAVYEVRLTDRVNIERNRAEIRNFLVSDWTSRGCAGSFMFCFRNDESVLRFSYVSKTWDFGEGGIVEKHETDTKKFTYLLGAGHRSRTAIKQFEELRDSQKKLQDITKAFSIEALSDRFFKDYKENYDAIIYHITGKRMVKVSNKWEEHFDGTPNQEIMCAFSHFPNPEKSVRDYVKKFMGRLVFLQFIQKKGWLGVPADKEWGNGDKEYLQHLYDQSNFKEDFIDKVLEPLFNDINTKRYADIATDGTETKIPYLNGGLFEMDDSDRVTFKLPSKYLKDMFDFFSSYNFTIDENDPNDAEIGVDPEMLGRIFENLLEDNKDKGAFYTPKEIVQYMCRESLIAYLQTDYSTDEATKESIRKFVTSHEVNDVPEAIRENIDSKLKSVKICDPAIGSGAFPMGLLKELYACRAALEGTYEDRAVPIKKEIIQNNIYGVDIEKGAVDIARLRFWLALIVDEKTPQTLPNMDFKIMQGNSLITTFDGKYVNLEKQQHINASKIEKLKQELHAKQDSFYDLFGNDKYVRDVEIKNLIIAILKQQIGYQEISSKEKEQETGSLFDDGQAETQASTPKVSFEYTELLEKLKIYESQINDTSKSIAERARMEIPFFDWKICFSDVFNRPSDCNGFDIVIGNPPYIRRTKIPVKDKKVYELKYKCADGQYDMYLLFIELGLSQLSNIGNLCFINPLRFFNSDSGYQSRRLIIDSYHIKKIIDVSQIEVFLNVMTYPCILFLDRKCLQDDYKFIRVYSKKEIDTINDAFTLECSQSFIKTDINKRFLIGDDRMNTIIQKIEEKSIRVSDRYDVSRGLPNNKVNFEGKDCIAIKSTNVKKYHFIGSTIMVGVDHPEIFHNEMIIMPRTVLTLQANIKPKDIICLDRIYYLESKVPSNNWGVLGIINSSLANYWFEFNYWSSKVSGGYFDLNGNQILSIPLPNDNPIINDISTIVEQIIHTQNQDSMPLTNRIDIMLFDYYGLTMQEREMVVNNVCL